MYMRGNTANILLVINSYCAAEAGHVNQTLLHIDVDMPIPNINSIHHNLVIEGMPM